MKCLTKFTKANPKYASQDDEYIKWNRIKFFISAVFNDTEEFGGWAGLDWWTIYGQSCFLPVSLWSVWQKGTILFDIHVDFFIFYVVEFVWFCCILFVMLICLDITLMSFWCPCIIWCPHVQLVLHLFPGQSFHCPVSLWTFYGPSRLYPDSVQFLCSHNGQSSFLILRADTLQTLASHQPVKHSEANRNKIGQSKKHIWKGQQNGNKAS